MKRIIIFTVVLTLAFAATSAQAENGFYVGGKVALSNVYMGDINLKNGSKDADFFSFGIGPVVGYDMAVRGGPSLRLEGEVLFRSGDDWKKSSANGAGKLDIDYFTTFLANGWYDITSIPVGGITIKPFVGASAGIGVVSYEAKRDYSSGSSSSKESTEAALLFGPGGGARFDISEHLVADASLRYLFSTKYDFAKFGEYDAPMLDLNFGLAYKF